MLTVVCFLWRDPAAKNRHVYTYTPDHVAVLARMVRRHLKQPHRFVCLTDDVWANLGDGVEAKRMDDVYRLPGTRFTKLQIFAQYMRGLGERLLCLDLDTVITGALDPLVDRDEDLVLWRNPNFGGKRRARYNTSIVLHRTGTRPEIFETFDPKTSPGILEAYVGGTDQAWVSHVCSAEEAHWTDKDGVYGAGRLLDVVPGVQTVLPENARIVFFPGRREPSMPEVHQLHPWIREHRV